MSTGPSRTPLRSFPRQNRLASACQPANCRQANQHTTARHLAPGSPPGARTVFPDIIGRQISRKTRKPQRVASQTRRAHPRCRDRRVSYHGREGVGRQSCRAYAERRVEGSVRSGGSRFERYGLGIADPDGQRGTQSAGLCRVSRSVAGGAAIAGGGKPCSPHTKRDAESGTVP